VHLRPARACARMSKTLMVRKKTPGRSAVYIDR
jgi:hypothetical protein